LAAYSEICTETHEHTGSGDAELLKLNDFASVLTNCAEKCAVNDLVNGHLEGQNKDGT
jgi:hypothetical protein